MGTGIGSGISGFLGLGLGNLSIVNKLFTQVDLVTIYVSAITLTDLVRAQYPLRNCQFHLNQRTRLRPPVR